MRRMSAPAECEDVSVVMMSDKESTPSESNDKNATEQDDYLTAYRAWFDQFAAQVLPDDQLPVYVAGYRVTPAELRGEVLAWTAQYLASKRCPAVLQAVLGHVVLQEASVAADADPQRFGFDEETKLYTPLRLMQAVIECVNSTCLRYLDNAQLDTLPPPPPSPSPREQFRPLSVSSTMKNSRRAMEDRHVEIPDLEALFGIQVEWEERTSLFGVYDGHVGGAAATYCAAHLHQYLCESEHYRTDLSRALADAFVRTDTEYVAKKNEKRANGGSTAVVVVVRGRTLLSGWVGDSQALLVKRYKYLPLVYPHRPDRMDERERIQSLGGQVMFWGTWRVNGQLAVSRAIGDARYKPYVSGEPELTAVTLEGDEDFVVIASDGLWDVLNEESVMLLVYCELLNNTDVLKAVPQRLILRAKAEGSGDNISVIVVFLREPYLICRDFVRMGPSVLPETCENGGMSAQEAAREWEGELAAQAQPDPAAFARLLAAADSERLRCAEGTEKAKDASLGRQEDESESESDSEDLGPETAVDGAEDVDADAEIQRLQADRDSEPACQPRTDTPTPPVHSTGVVSALAENVGESGDESEDEWNYIKGEEKELEESASPPSHRDRSPSPPPRAADIDRGAWEEEDSSDMNSSPLNPEAPVFVPGGAESPLPVDRLIAESPRKPLPMDDGELPDSRQFASEATERPADINDMLNGHHHHHTITLEEKMNLNGDNKLQLESELLQDFARVQRDTTDFCNIQVGYAQAGDMDLVGRDIDQELFERLKSKERDPMSMSFYSENYATEPAQSVDLNAVQLLPDSDDEIETPSDDDKENNYPMSVAYTDTPESHKLLFEQIPETPHGKPHWSDDASAVPSALPHFLAEPGADLDMDLISQFQEPAPSANDDTSGNFESGDGPNPFANDLLEKAFHVTHDNVANVDNSVFDSEPNLFSQESVSLGDNKLESQLLRQEDVVDELISYGINTDMQADQNTELEPEMPELDEPLIPQSDCTPDLSAEPSTVSPQPELSLNLVAASPQLLESPVPASPVADCAEPLAFSPEHRTLSPHPPARSPVPIVLSPEPTAASPEPVALSPEPPTCSPKLSALPLEPDAHSEYLFEQTTLSPEAGVLLAEPVLSPLPAEPVALSPVPVAVSPEPAIASSEVAASPSPSPLVESTIPDTNSLEPPLELSEPRIPSPQTVQFQSPTVPEQTVKNDESLENSGPLDVEEQTNFSDPLHIHSPVPHEMPMEVEEAQEVCIPVPDEIPSETKDMTTPTPPPTPAADLGASLGFIQMTEVQETPIVTDTPAATDAAIPIHTDLSIVAGVAAATAAATGAAVAAAKTKTPTAAKKSTAPTKTAASPTKSATKPPINKTPTTTQTAKKTPVTTSSATQRTPIAAAKPSPLKATAAKTLTAKPASPATKPSATTTRTPPTKTTTSAKPAVAVAAKTLAAKAAPVKPATLSARPAPARPAPARTSATRPPAAAPSKAKPATTTKPAEVKPLTNGDVRPPIKKPAPGTVAPLKAATAVTAPKPAPRPLAARTAPRTVAPAPPRVAPTKIAPRAPLAAPRVPADKQSKDLANKRLSTTAASKTAPPRTGVASKTVSRGGAKSAAGAKKETEKVDTPKLNGSHEPADEVPVKPAPTPQADNALLPDLVA